MTSSDPGISKLFLDLRTKLYDASHNARSTEAQILAKEREIKRLDLTSTSLKRMSSGSDGQGERAASDSGEPLKVYTGLGNIFIKSTLSDVLANQSKRIESLRQDMEALKKKEAYYTRIVKESEKSLGEITKAVSEVSL